MSVVGKCVNGAEVIFECGGMVSVVLDVTIEELWIGAIQDAGVMGRIREYRGSLY